jgi:hypothetical protein
MAPILSSMSNESIVTACETGQVLVNRQTEKIRLKEPFERFFRFLPIWDH